jgi:hypothetical protein
VVDADAIAGVLESMSADMAPLHPSSEERLVYERRAIEERAEIEVPDLSIYYSVEAPDSRTDELAESLLDTEGVVGAYVKPPALPPVAMSPPEPSAEAPPVETPDFTPRQGYLDPAPSGIDAKYAWGIPGGSGAGVQIIDIEGEWRFTHEDLLTNHGGLVGGTPPNNRGWRDHGTAVIGAFSGDANAFGVTGICPDANVRAISIFGPQTADSAPAIRLAANSLEPGDIMLLELHRPGPRHSFKLRDDQVGYVAIEWWPDDFDAIRYAIAKGIVVVEAAGNGAQDLDDPLYDLPQKGFPPDWTNPFKREIRDSGAIVVGAGAPPPGVHGRDHGPDRSRLDFSNFGELVDAQGWGREVTSCGYGDLQGGTNEDEWYTDRFSGTSSASPIVVGALGAVQGAALAAGRPPVAADRLRELLRRTGSPQQDGPGRPMTERIGSRPNLRELLPVA